MPTLQIKNVPADVRRVVQRRAAKAGKSEQEYLLKLLTDAARQPTLDEVFERIERRTGTGMSPASVVEMLREDRDAR